MLNSHFEFHPNHHLISNYPHTTTPSPRGATPTGVALPPQCNCVVPVGTATPPPPTLCEHEHWVTNLIEARPKEGNEKEGARRDRRGGKEEKRGGEEVVEARRRQVPGRQPPPPPPTNNEDTQGNGKRHH